MWCRVFSKNINVRPKLLCQWIWQVVLWLSVLIFSFPQQSFFLELEYSSKVSPTWCQVALRTEKIIFLQKIALKLIHFSLRSILPLFDLDLNVFNKHWVDKFLCKAILINLISQQNIAQIEIALKYVRYLNFELVILMPFTAKND